MRVTAALSSRILCSRAASERRRGSTFVAVAHGRAATAVHVRTKTRMAMATAYSRPTLLVIGGLGFVFPLVIAVALPVPQHDQGSRPAVDDLRGLRGTTRGRNRRKRRRPIVEGAPERSLGGVELLRARRDSRRGNMRRPVGRGPDLGRPNGCEDSEDGGRAENERNCDDVDWLHLGTSSVDHSKLR
jgi:hypothetical protein